MAAALHRRARSSKGPHGANALVGLPGLLLAEVSTLKRLVEMAGLIRENERLILGLEALAIKTAAARSYLNQPRSNLRLAIAYLGHLKTKRSRLLVRLRRNRIDAERMRGWQEIVDKKVYLNIPDLQVRLGSPFGGLTDVRNT